MRFATFFFLPVVDGRQAHLLLVERSEGRRVGDFLTLWSIYTSSASIFISYHKLFMFSFCTLFGLMKREWRKPWAKSRKGGSVSTVADKTWQGVSKANEAG